MPRAATAFARAAGFSLALLCGAAVAASQHEAQAGVEIEASDAGYEAFPAADTAAGNATEVAEPERRSAARMLRNAMNFLGVAYHPGGTSERSGFDCSGFTRHIVQMTFGFVLPRRAEEQAGAAGLRKVRQEELQPGDLLFFNTRKHSYSHVAIYLGDGKFIHSPRAGGRVRIEDMGFAYWRKRFNGARRLGALIEAAGAAAAPVLTALPQPGL